ncbi:MAG TPA: cytidylate kinase-like family protein [Bacteroidales bacterium]|nr:cytidylate kinase-like family protein [Bacteroidales bacterium]
MNNLLMKYMESRFQEQFNTEPNKPQPFVTISREFGCPSKLIARMLAEELNRRSGNVKGRWQYISKEIIEQAARELELEPVKIEHLFRMDQTGILDDLLSSFSSNYKSTQKIRKTIRDVIQTFTKKGHVILVGRGSVALTHDRPNSLHIRLQAPLDWRVRCISKHNGIPISEALHLAIETDKKRTALIESFLGYKLEPALFDAIFNCKTLSNPDIVSTILKMMESLKMI